MDQRLMELYQARQEIKAVLGKYGVDIKHSYEELFLEADEEGGDGIRWEAEQGEDTLRQDLLGSARYTLQAGRTARLTMQRPDGGWEYREVTLAEVEAEIERLKKLYS
jgi:hypothetical protein